MLTIDATKYAPGTALSRDLMIGVCALCGKHAIVKRYAARTSYIHRGQVVPKGKGNIFEVLVSCQVPTDLTACHDSNCSGRIGLSLPVEPGSHETKCGKCGLRHVLTYSPGDDARAKVRADKPKKKRSGPAAVGQF